MNIFSWVKNNWLVLVLVLVIVGLLMKGSGPVAFSSRNLVATDMALPYEGASKGISMPSPRGETSPVISDQRMVVQDTSLSMQVKDVSVTIKGIEKVADQMGGYMVNKSVTKPEGAATGNITFRVPVEKRESTLDAVRTLGVKVVSENVYGNDVTDQYVDIETRVANLEKTKAKMLAIQDQATNISDLFQIQSQIDNIQQQIDNLKGQQNYLQQTAKLTRITVYLSTDELALPYAPDEAWRPGVVFKTAVRSMIGALRGVVNAIIWGVVYLPLIALAVVLVYLSKKIYYRFFNK